MGLNAKQRETRELAITVLQTLDKDYDEVLDKFHQEIIEKNQSLIIQSLKNHTKRKTSGGENQ
ncbi:hypothetical protein JMJ06_000212 [Enterococcus faecalis]|nr:hypothetical protein [Enterococcus faecalis]